MEDTKAMENSSLSQISAIKLDGAGTYLAWSRACLLFIKSRKMLGYITGDKKPPNVSDTTYAQWDSENSLVMTWLLNTMHSRISKQYLLLDTAEKIWNSAKRTYSRKGNDAQIFEIRNKIHGTKQGELTITEYYSELSGLWQEIDYYQDLQAHCTEDAVLFQKLVEKERVYDFLVGLNPEYDQIRVQVLGKIPFPSHEDAYSHVQQEESRRGVMLYQAPIEKSGLAASHDQPKIIPSDKDHVHCEYCGKPRHTKETCWKLHGRPTRGRGGKRINSSRAQANVAETVETSKETGSGEILSSEEIQHLRRLITKLDSSTIATSNHVQSGTAFTASLNSWVIDSCANRHMTGSTKNLQNYSSCLKEENVRIADGSLTSVSGTGSIICTPDIKLSSVLHIPDFPVNLLSVSSITKDLNCKIVFFPDRCVFQDLETGKRIGSGRLHDGLYMFDGTKDSGQAFFGDNKDVNLEILQWHRRLGHPSFFVLKKLYLSLFLRTQQESLFCDACEYAKHTRNSYPLNNNKSTIPFMTIHSDVWGPTQTPSLSGSRWFVTFIDCCTRMTWVYLLKAKSEVFSCFQLFHKMICTQFDTKIKILRTDNGTEYMNKNFDAYLESNGIIHQTSCPYTSAQNGVAERKNRHLLEVARSLMFTMNLPKPYWGDAILVAAYLINRMPLKTLDFQSPLEALKGKNEYIVPPKVFGCVCFVHTKNAGKLDPRALKCVFIGYSPTQKGYK